MWNDLTLKQKAEIMKMSVANGVTDINDIQSLYDNSIPNQFDDGGFMNFYNSLPRNQRDSTNYNVRRYWELNGRPKDFNEAIQRGMYTKQSDGWHANSVAYNEAKDEYEFMKSPTHPTTIYEIGAYLNNKDFQKEYYLDYTSKPNYKYRRKPSWMYNNGGHIYKNAGKLDKAKDQSKYQYGIIEQILRENGVNFRVTSGARKPNQAGNAGKSSAHTYTIFGGSPGAIDIVPGVGSDWNTLFAQMSSPEVKKALASYGLDILNETNPSVMASTKATGPHLHVGRGIKGQQGLGQIFGGTSYGGGRGDTYRLQYPSQRNSDYASMYSQNAFEPIVIGGNNTSNPWLDYIRSVESIGNQGINPVSNTPIRPTNTGLNGIKSTFTPTDFSSLSNSSDVVSPLEPYAAKQNIEYGLGLEGNALWNSPYLMFDNHSAANGGHLFDTAGQMLIRDNAVNPGLRYVYGDDYEEYIRQLRNYRPANTERRVKPRYNLSQQTDVIGNTAKPVNKSIRNKQINSPQRQQKEQKLANDRYWQNERERQGTISQASNVPRDPVYNREFANEVQALREREAEEAKKRYPVDLAMKQGFELMEAMPWPSTVAGSLFNPNTHWYEPGSFFGNLYANDNRGFFNYNQATRDFYDANPEIGGVVNLAGDFIVPCAAAKVLKGVGRAGKFAAEIPYNTIGGQFGYYGDNILQRAYSTVLRNSSLKNLDRGRSIEFIRKLDIPLELNSNGKITLSNRRFVKDGKPIDHINVSSDRQVASHKRGSWEDKPYTYIIKEKPIIEQANLKSIEPSDTFGYGSKVEVNPSDITLVTGDIEEIRKAKKLGMDVMSSKKLRSLYKELEKIKYPNSSLTLKEKAALPNPKNADISKAYRIEMQNVMNRRGHPTVKDYSLLESKTGLNAGIIPIENAPNYLKFENDVRTAMRNGDSNIPVMKFPNGREVDINELLNTRHDPYHVPYYNVWYDPITQADAEFRLANDIVPRNNSNAQLDVDGILSNLDKIYKKFEESQEKLKAGQHGALRKAEEKVFDYLGSEKHVQRIMESGVPREQAEAIARDMRSNAMATEGNIGYTITPDAIGEYNAKWEPSHKGRFRSVFGNNKPSFAPEYTTSPVSPEDIYNNVLHELGGHGATMGYSPTRYINDFDDKALGLKAQAMYELDMERWSPHYKEVYENNSKLKPVRKEEYKDSKDSHIEYLEGVDEYSARARAYNIDPSVDREDVAELYKYFTKESVDKLLKGVWSLLPAGIGLGVTKSKSK